MRLGNLDLGLAAVIDDVAGRLGMASNWLRAIISFETGGTFSSSARNPITGATGLIQFMPSTARSLGTTTEQLARMSAPEQMEYVYRYLAPYAGRMRTVEDAYMAVLWPAGIGAAPDDIIFPPGSAAYKANKALDRGGKGYVTKADAAAHVVALAGEAPESFSGSTGGVIDLSAGAGEKKTSSTGHGGKVTRRS